jgi:hypothetical protein
VTPAQGSFGAGTYSVGSSTRLLAQDSSGGAGSGQLRGRHPPPGADQLRGRLMSPAQGSSGAGTCPVDSSTHLPAQDSSGSVACPRNSGSEEKLRAE